MYDEHCPASGKRCYHDKDAALAELRRLKRNEKQGKRLVAVYRCTARHCSGWHLTSRKSRDVEDWQGFLKHVEYGGRNTVTAKEF
jgi:hypothetical protein